MKSWRMRLKGDNERRGGGCVLFEFVGEIRFSEVVFRWG